MKTFSPWLLLFSVLMLASSGFAGEQVLNRKNPDGIWMLLAVKEEGANVATSVERAKTVIAKRCYLLRIACRIERPFNDQPNKLMLRFSTRMSPGRVKEILLAAGVEVRAIVGPSFPEPLREYPSREMAEAARSADQKVFPLVDGESETYVITGRTLILTGNDLRSCVYDVFPEGSGQYQVNCRLRPAGSARLKTWTTANIDNYAAIIFNGRIVSAAYIRAPIYYDFEVSAGFNKQQAQDLAVIFDSGNLPPTELLEEGTYRR